MKENIVRLNSVLIYEKSYKTLRESSMVGLNKLIQKDPNAAKNKLKLSVKMNRVLKHDSSEIIFLQSMSANMLLSFCVELAIKALSYQKGKTINVSHDLNNLFNNKLDKESRDNIRSEVMNKMNISIDDFNEKIQINNNGFVRFRYLWEKSTQLDPNFLMQLLKSVKNQINWSGVF